MQVKLIIDGIEHEVDAVAFRRILTSAQAVFTRLRKEEGPMFPAVDKQAARIITDLQFKHRELI